MRAKALFRRMIERGLAMPWTYTSTAVFRLDTELVDLMVESGCEYINIAICLFHSIYSLLFHLLYCRSLWDAPLYSVQSFR